MAKIVASTKTSDVPRLSDLFAGKYSEYVSYNSGIKIHDYESEDFWGIYSLVNGTYYNLYLGIDGLSGVDRTITGGIVKAYGLTTNDGPQDDADDIEPDVVKISGLDISLLDYFNTFDVHKITFDNAAWSTELLATSDNITLSPENDTINSGPGNDTIDGGAGNDTLDGGDGDDDLSAGSGDDNLYGGEGNDLLRLSSSGTQLFDGGIGEDTLVLELENWTTAPSDFVGEANLITEFLGWHKRTEIPGEDKVKNIENITLKGDIDYVLIGNDDDNILITDGGSDTLEGGAGNDTMTGGSGADTLEGGVGNDTMTGGSGTDTFKFSYGFGNDTITDFEHGVDTLEYSGSATIGSSADGYKMYTAEDGSTLTLNGVSETKYGATEGDDVLNGTSGYNIINGLGGNDTINALAGNDTLDGGAGNDILYGGVGDDIYIYDGSGNDIASDQSGQDTLRLNADAAIISDSGGYRLNDDLIIEAKDGANKIVFQNAFGENGLEYFNYVNTGFGVDVTRKLNSADYIPEEGSHYLVGTTKDDNISASGTSNISAVGYWGNDTITGGDQADYLFGGVGNDVLTGGAGNDTLDGGDGDDDLSAGSGDDNLYGGEGNDLLRLSSSGTQLFDGGIGEDTLVLELENWTTAPSDFVGEANLITEFLGWHKRTEIPGEDKVKNIENITLKGDIDYVLIGNDDDNILITDGGSDTLEGGAGNDTMTGGSGTDTFKFSYGFGNDTITDFEHGVDILEYSGSITIGSSADGYKMYTAEDGSTLTLNGVSGTNDVTEGDDVLNGTSGDDIIAGLEGNETINGGAGDDELYGGAGNDTLDGGAGDDILYGGAGDDTLDGGAGNDTLSGGDGDDILDGGAGADRYIYNLTAFSGHDTIILENDGEDTLIGYDADGSILGDDDFVVTTNDDGYKVYTTQNGQGSITVKSLFTTPTITESIGAISLVNSGTSSSPVLDFYLDKTKDPGDAGVTSVDVVLKFDPTHASFTSFSYANGLLSAANEALASNGTITFSAIALPAISTDKPLFTMTMKDLDSTADFAVTVSDLNIDGSALEGSTLLVGSPASHTVTTSVVTRDGSKISNADVVLSDGTNSSSYKSANDGNISGSLTSGSASTVKASLTYSSSTKAINSQDALDTLKLSVGMTTAAGTKNSFDFMSADFNQDGKVSSQDALSILKYSVGLPTSEEAKWVFVDTNGDYSGVSKSNTSYTEGVTIADLSADATVSLTGILIGDVNDSYSGLIA